MALTPTSSLVQVFTDISTICQTLTDTNIYPDTGIQPGGVPSLFGGEYLLANTNAPQWLWVPLSETGGPPVFGGPMLADDIAEDIVGNNAAPTPLCSRNALVEIHCWGADGTSTTDPTLPYKNAETLLNIVVQQSYFYASPMSVKFEGGAFEQAREFTRAGRVYKARMTFRFPIVQEPDVRAVVTSFPLTQVMDLPA